MVSDLYLSFDDYIIMSSLSKDKSETSYIVFDLNGNIIGITEEIFEMVFEESKLSVREMKKLSNIFLIFPEILEVLLDNFNEIMTNKNLEENSQVYLINSFKTYVGLLDSFYKTAF